jgi:hypothetical protein
VIGADISKIEIAFLLIKKNEHNTMTPDDLYNIILNIEHLVTDTDRATKLIVELVRTNFDMCIVPIRCAYNGSSMIHFAAQSNKVTIVNGLINGGIDKNLTNAAGDTPVYWAAHNGCDNVIRLLYKRGADLDKCGKNGTPLHIAAKNSHKTSVELLLELGADIEKKNADGKTPFDVAHENGKNSIAAILETELQKKKNAQSKNEQNIAVGQFSLGSGVATNPEVSKILVSSALKPDDQAKNNKTIVCLAKTAWKYLTVEQRYEVMRVVSAVDLVTIREAIGDDF